MNGGASGVSPPQLEVENEELRQEVMRLQVSIYWKKQNLNLSSQLQVMIKLFW